MASMFATICTLHSIVALTCGASMMFFLKEITVVAHGVESAQRLAGSTPNDQSLVRISNSFAGLLLLAIGFLVLMVGLVKDEEFHGFFAKGCVLLHVSMAIWRCCFERRLEELARDWPKQVVGDLSLALSWVFFLVYSWRERYMVD